MRRTTSAVACLAVLGGLTLSPPAEAGSRDTIEFTDVQTFGADSGSVTTSLADCPTATSVTELARFGGARFFGYFVGIRDLQCGDGSGFVVRLTAMFDDTGSVGTWSIVDSYGDLEGLRGSGTLVGTPIDETSISDHYTGNITWAG